MLARIAVFGSAWLFCGCASTLQSDAPALLADPGPDSHAEIARVVSAALKVDTVTIADDALTRSSTLVIERRPARDAGGQRLGGRDFDKPAQFQLVTDGKRCILVHLDTGERHELTKARCREADGG